MKARVRYAVRDQVEMRCCDLDSLLPEDHPARIVWEYVEGMDLSRLYEEIGSEEGRAGRPAIDPRILMALWLQATLEGIGSARSLARRCERDAVYEWICGGVSVNHHTLSDFRVQHVKLLDRLLTESVAALVSEGLVHLNRVAHDGMRTKANAGKGSLRKKESLERHLEEAEEQIRMLKEELESDPAAGTKRERAARARAVRQRKERVQRAREELEKAKKSRRHGEREKKNVRCSTTDPEARVMKMPEGGFAPAYNVQLSSDTETQIVVGVEVSQEGVDTGLLLPAMEQLEQRYGNKPPQVLADGGFVNVKAIHQLESEETEVYAPPKEPTDPNRGRYEPWRRDSAQVAGWRVRMGTQEAQAIYRERAWSIECVNAQMRNRGLRQLPVRGLRKVKAVILWFALAHNLMKGIRLRAAMAT